MVAHSKIALRRPNKPGFMAPAVVLEMANAVNDVMGVDNLELALKEAQLFRMPSVTEPVREDKAARLHQTVRKLWPEDAAEISEIAGKAAAQRIIETQITVRAQAMLAKMPRATGAWLLAKTARQNAWTFAGGGDFIVESESRFVLHSNPVVFGEVANGAVCQFHASLFEEMFRTLIHPRLVCKEVACQASGADACTFEFVMAPH
ncbi:bacteriochlorophyll 4-vinyl reductase [Octadecabacter sp. G9-8]|uniref:Bacteriochlorophyll 4-vinyl reductase n=1 Tax=Octadecabacter dasysiphoniae TaxID=2909341 RepID=A0ABS9CZC2_9RHOB|nr:bacteriochlorophyll 4-vinyl reductase [Octadecabacter dasysiphoniae]MCF2872417.1 bacteriochlorophyll 4-vinyl reductase [Octadecabacter dasysiphoniae]